MKLATCKRGTTPALPLTLRDAVQQFYNDSFWDPFGMLREFSVLEHNLSIPRIDISEDADQLTVEADVPGFDAESITAEIDDGVLTIHGEESEARESTTDKRYFTRERSARHFERRIALPRNVDTDNVQCTLAQGTLTVSIPKKEQKNSEKKLKIAVK